MKLNTKLILSFSAIILLLLVIGLAGQFLNEVVRNRMALESRKAINEMQLSQDIGLELYRSIINIQFLLEDRYREESPVQGSPATYKAPQKAREAIENVRIKLSEYKESRQVTRDTAGTPGTAENTLETIENLESKFEIYSRLVTQLFSLTEQSYSDGREFFSVTIEPYFRSNLLPVIGEIRAATEKNLNGEFQQLNARLGYTSKFLIIATIAALVLASLVTYFLYRSIATPLERLSAAAKDIGMGNLSKRIEVDSDDEIGQLANEFNRMAANLNKTTVSKEYVTNIIESMADALIVVDADYRIRRVNSAAMEMLGYGQEILEHSFGELLADSGTALLTEKQEREFDGIETHLLGKGGRKIPVSISKALMYDRAREVTGIVFVASDITERLEAKEKISRSLKEKEVLLAEIHHRVKNNLAVISGLLQMQVWDTENNTARKALIDSQLRVQSIALVHEKLYQSESLSYIELGNYIRDLLQAIHQTYEDSGSDITLETDVENVVLNINQAIPCSLIINEMVVNAYKHAFVNGEQGRIKVRAWSIKNRVYLEVSDNGAGVPENLESRDSESLGMSLLETLTDQLKGEISIKNDEGAVFAVNFKRQEVS